MGLMVLKTKPMPIGGGMKKLYPTEVVVICGERLGQHQILMTQILVLDSLCYWEIYIDMLS